MAFGLVGGDCACVGQEEFCFAGDKRVVGLGLLPRIGQAADLAHENHFDRPGWTNRLRRFVRSGMRVLVPVGARRHGRRAADAAPIRPVHGPVASVSWSAS